MRARRPGAADPYRFFTRPAPIPHGPFTPSAPSIAPSDTRETAMLDVLYFGLGAAGFALFALAVRSLERA